MSTSVIGWTAARTGRESSGDMEQIPKLVQKVFQVATNYFFKKHFCEHVSGTAPAPVAVQERGTRDPSPAGQSRGGGHTSTRTGGSS